MPGRQAKLVTSAQLEALLQQVRHTRDWARARVLLLLSFQAGLRASEIAKLTWPMVLDASGEHVGMTIELEDRIAKKGSGRRVPIHPELRSALKALHRRRPYREGPVVRSRKGGHMRPNSIVFWFWRLYRQVGFKGCSSHSGRRSFATMAARKVHEAGGSLIDVQQLLGHRSITTTQRYVSGDTSAQRKLVSLL